MSQNKTKKIYASSSKLSGVAGCKTHEMTSFLENAGDGIESKQVSFTGQDGKEVTYVVYEAVEALYVYETFLNIREEREKEYAKEAAKAPRRSDKEPEGDMPAPTPKAASQEDMETPFD